MHAARLLDLLTIFAVLLVTSDCQQTETSKALPPQATKVEPAAASKAARFETPRAVYKQYAESLNASRWDDAIAVFTKDGKPKLVLSNFKALVVLAATQHPKQDAYKSVLREFCQGHGLRCANENWSAAFTSTLLNQGDVTKQLSDVSALAAAKPEATYSEIMKLLQGVDSSSVVPLDPTLSQVLYKQNTATGNARRGDGQSTMLSFESSPDGGWLIVE